MSFKVTKAAKRNIPFIYPLIKRVIYGTPYYPPEGKKMESSKYTPAGLKEKLESKSWLVLVAKNKNQIAGFLSGYFDYGVFWVDWIGVDEEYRRQGLAIKIMKELETIAGRNKVHKIWLDTIIANKEAISMFTSLGFKKIANLKNHWYHDDFYLWERVLRRNK